YVGLLVSWHWGTAAGASIAASAVAFFFVSALAAALRSRLTGKARPLPPEEHDSPAPLIPNTPMERPVSS
ncbi:MAG: metal ABC transporter permease, partial [Nocardiopsis sp. BM-2018]